MRSCLVPSQALLSCGTNAGLNTQTEQGRDLNCPIQSVCSCMCFCNSSCWTMQGRIHASASHRARQAYCLPHTGAALVRPGSDHLCTKGFPLIICMLQGDEYDELGSVPSQLHDVIIGASDDESQSLVYGASDADGQSCTDASERFRPGSSTGSVSDFGTKSPSQL